MIQCRHIAVFNNIFRRHVAEQCDFIFNVLADFVLGAQNDDVGANADAEQFFDGVLGRFGFQFHRRAEIRYQCDVHKHAVACAFLGKLANRLQKRLAFNVADRAADFHQNNVNALCFVERNPAFDFVGDVRNNLNGLSAVNAFAFVGKDVVIHTARSAGAVFG